MAVGCSTLVSTHHHHQPALVFPDLLLQCGDSLSQPLRCHAALLAALSPALGCALAGAGAGAGEEALLLLPDCKREELAGLFRMLYGLAEECRVSGGLLTTLGISPLGGTKHPQESHAAKQESSSSVNKTFVLENEEYEVEEVEETFITVEGGEGIGSNSIQRNYENPNDLINVKFLCDICKELFSAQEELELHQRKAHQSGGGVVYQCSICSVMFPSLAAHTAHSSQKQGGRFVCTACSAVLCSMRQLVEHVASQHAATAAAPPQPFQCGGCGSMFAQAAALHNHAPGCGPAPAPLLPLDQLPRLGPVQGREQVTIVTSDPPADIDPIVVLNQGPGGAISEVLIHSDNLELEQQDEDPKYEGKNRKYVCKYCQSRYYAKDHLLSHMRTHTGEKPFECGKCKERFMYRSTWSNHKVRCIEGPEGMNRFRKFRCGFCDSSFLARGHQQQHERIHTGEKPWKCDQCGDKFQYRNRWKTHVRKCTGSEPTSSKLEQIKNMANKKYGQFKCSYCNQIFKKTNRLEKHAQMMHPGLQHFSCDMCGEKFSYEVSLSEHLSKHKGHKVGISGERATDLRMVMVDGADENVVHTELVDSLHSEQVVECETVFETGNFTQSGELSNNSDTFVTYTAFNTDDVTQDCLEVEEDLRTLKKRHKFVPRKFE